MAYGTINADVIGTSVAGSNLGAGNASIMKNRIINGAMVIDQRNAGASVTIGGGNTYTLDRFSGFASQASKYSIQQNAGAVTPPVGFTNYLGVTSLSAYTVGAAERFAVRHAIEGYNVADLGWGSANAKTITLSFWAYSSLTGTFGGALRNDAGDRSYPFSYSIPVANTWTQIAITIAGSTSGTWGTTNNAGIPIWFSLGTGSTYSGTAGTWANADYSSATGATSVVGTNGATFYITGVQLEVGSSATGFEYVNYQTSLANCQRYYAKMGTAGTLYTAFGSAGWTSTTGANLYLKYPTTMRSSPTLSYGGVIAVTYGGGATSNVTGVGTTYSGTDSTMWQPSGLSGGVNGQGGVVLAFNDATAFISLSAEL
jgi:hypothetical protein